jgi:hypothetical protein
MKSLKAWVLLLLVFGAGFGGGIAASRIVLRHFVQRAIKDPDFMRRVIEKRMAFRLRLDSAQRGKLDEILRHTQTELAELRGEFQPRFFSIITDTQSEIDEILTPAQRERLQKLKAENQQWWQGR